MIWFTGPKSREFSFLNLMAIETAHRVQKPDAFFLYCNDEPTDNPWWEQAREYCQIVKMEAPTHYRDASLNNWPQYQADVVRLEKLYEMGGIYLDTDTILLKPLSDLMSHSVVLSGKIDGKVDDENFISGGLMMTAPGSDFFRFWLENLEAGILKHVWAWHCVKLPVLIAQEHPDLLHLLPPKSFTPFDFHDDWIWDEATDDDVMRRFGEPYAAHMWDSVMLKSWTDKFKLMNEEYIKTSPSFVGRLLRRSFDYS